MHILFLSDNFPPEVNAPASRTFEHSREWVKSGVQVTVITCAPNFPSGKVLAGYKNRLWQSEMIDGIRVVRVWSFIAANEGFARRTIDYVSFMVSATLAAPFVGRVDVVAGTSPQFLTVCAARVVAAMKRVPFVFELRDLWPDSIKAVGAMRDGAAIRFLSRIEMHLYRRADAIVCVTRSFKRILIGRGIDAGKISVVMNGADLARYRPQPRDTALEHSLGLEGKFVVGYVGTHGMAHALETLVDAARLLQDRQECRHIRFVFLGDGARKRAIEAYAVSRGATNILFLASVPKDDVVRHWSLVDVSVVHLRDTELFTTVIPSKIFEAMAMGIPILHGVRGEAAALLEGEGVSLGFTPENAGELAEAIARLCGNRALYEAMRSRCLLAAQRYERSTLALAMLEDIRAAVRRHGAVTTRPGAGHGPS